MVFHFQMRGNYPPSPHLAPKAFFVRNLVYETLNQFNTGSLNISDLASDIEDSLAVFQHRYGVIDWMQNICRIRSFLARDVNESKLQLQFVPNSEEGYRHNEYHILVLLSNPYSSGIIGVEWLIRSEE